MPSDHSIATASGIPLVLPHRYGHTANMNLSGPQHYKEAERLLRKAGLQGADNEAKRADRLQRAQVHATLALVAATAQAGQLSDMQLRDWRYSGLKT